jgi:hypothetical protein
VPLVYGHYYYFDVSTNVASIVANTDRYVHGRMLDHQSDNVTFPVKKQDLLFQFTGSANSDEAPYPFPTTNIANPTRCFVANPSGKENTAYGPRNQFNVLIREGFRGTVGSFWADYNADPTLTALKGEIANMIQEANDSTYHPSIAYTYPYNNYQANNSLSFPTYYSQMNFYISVADPSVDTKSDGGFQYCANIDAIVEVIDDSIGCVGSAGTFTGGVCRGPLGHLSTNWGTSQGFTLTHEVFGHGIAGLDDEGFAPYNSKYVSLEGNYLPDALPISAADPSDEGCNIWCGGIQPRSWLVGQTTGTSGERCWAATSYNDCNAVTDATCNGASGQCCSWIGELDQSSMPYWDCQPTTPDGGVTGSTGTNCCIPQHAYVYNIGVNCPSNVGCYPFAGHNTAIPSVNVVVPGGSIMTGFAFIPGFTGPIEQHIKDELDCVFNIAPCTIANSPRCTNLVNRWGTPGNGYTPFLQNALDCDADGTTIRRR